MLKLRSRRGLIIFSILLMTIVLATVFSIFIFTKDKVEDPIPSSIKQKVGFSLYYPTKLPDEFRFDEIAYDSEAKVVTYSYSATGGKRLYFSQQKKPDNFNFDDFRNKQLAGSTQLDTNLGKATIGLLQNQTTSSIVTDDTWILISVGGDINIDQLKEVSQNLAKSNK